MQVGVLVADLRALAVITHATLGAASVRVSARAGLTAECARSKR